METADGQHKGQTYEEVSRKVEFVKWALLQPSPASHLRDLLTWFNKYYTIKEGLDNRPDRETHASLGIPEGTYNPRPRGKGSKKVPPNPPKDRCANCTDCSYAGSSANFVRKTCRDCGNVARARRARVHGRPRRLLSRSDGQQGKFEDHVPNLLSHVRDLHR